MKNKMFEQELKRAVENNSLTKKEKDFWIDLKSSFNEKKLDEFIKILKENNDKIQNTLFEFDININKFYKKHLTKWKKFN